MGSSCPVRGFGGRLVESMLVFVACCVVAVAVVVEFVVVLEQQQKRPDVVFVAAEAVGTVLTLYLPSA